MGNLLGIGETAQALGVSKQTLRKRDEEGRLKPTEITLGGHRRYNLSKIQTPRFHPIGQPPRKTVAYAGVSSTDQKQDLTVFSARLDGSRSNKTKKMIESMQEVVTAP